MRKIMVTTLVGLITVLGSRDASAQERGQQDQGAARREQGQRDRNEQGETAGRERDVRSPGNANSQQIDRELANCLAIDNWAEIELAKFAADKAQSSEVKELIQTLQQDHTQFVNRLKQIEPTVAHFVKLDGSDSGSERSATGAARDNNADRPGQSQSGVANPDASPANPAGQGAQGAAQSGAQAGTQSGAPGNTIAGADTRGAARGNREHAQMLQIKQEITQACLNTLKQELGAKSESEFDRCFVGYQVHAHLRMVDTLKVFERHASPELAQLINEGLQSTQMHLKTAKQLLAKYDNSGASSPNPTSRVQNPNAPVLK